jgi:hypothetical protein
VILSIHLKAKGGETVTAALGAAVIDMAIRDFVRSKGDDMDAYRFLRGQTEISRFWFQVAGVMPIQGTPKEMNKKLKGMVWGSETFARTKRSKPVR